MRAAPLVSGLFLVAVASPVLAQTPECSAYVSDAQRVCAAAVDGTRAFHPLIGVLVSGGNPMHRLSRPAWRSRARLAHPARQCGRGGASGSVVQRRRSIVPAGDKLWAPAPRSKARSESTGESAMDCSPSICWARRSCCPTDQIDNLTVDAERTEESAAWRSGWAMARGWGC